MRYRLLVAYALVSCGSASLSLFGEPFESLGAIHARAAYGDAVFAPVFSGSNFNSGTFGDSFSGNPGWVFLPGSGHNGASVPALPIGLEQADVWQSVQQQLRSWLESGWTHAPALVMGMAVVVVAAPLAIAGWIFQRAHPSSSPDVTRRLVVASGKSVARFNDHDTPSARMAFSQDALLERSGPVAGGGATTSYELGRSDLVVRIGREEDNDIQIRDKTVHRYHAVIDRSMDGGISISDMSSNEGNGVIVNGQRVVRAQLRDGDRIGLGAVSLTFRLKAV